MKTLNFRHLMIGTICLIINANFSTEVNAQSAATIDVAQQKQVIDGFGASTAWHGPITDAEAEAAFGNADNTQMGLSIVRVRISPNPSDWSGWVDEKNNALKAKARGAMVFASPWSPPASMKSNNNVINGGTLLASSYQSYASHLQSFCTYLGNVDVVSIQNEPDITVDYESCVWTAQQLLDFSKNWASAIGTPVMAPESYNFDYALSNPILNDATANAKIQYIGGHLYGTTTRSYPLATVKGKKLWMTEHYFNPDTIGTCLDMAKEIIDCMNGNMNAYVWWYLRLPGCNLINSGGSLKFKGATMGQFSKFIRPGFVRVYSSYQPNAGVYMQAFKGPETDVIVVSNQNYTPISQTFNFSNETIDGASKYVTSSVKKINNEGQIETGKNSFTDNLEPRSISTYVVYRSKAGLHDTKNKQFTILQNPADDFLTLSSVENLTSIDIFNMQGCKVKTINSITSSIDISSLPQGTYIVCLKGKGIYQNEKLIKK